MNKLCNNAVVASLGLAIITANSIFSAQAFMMTMPMRSAAASYRRAVISSLVHSSNNNNNIPSTRLYGILDEIDDSVTSSSSTSDDNQNEEEVHQQLLEDVIFSTRPVQSVVEDQLEECSDPGFVQWLETMLDNSDDAEEQAALQELLETIQVVVQAKAAAAAAQLVQQQERAKEQQKQQSIADNDNDNDTSAEANQSMSTADVLKRAGAIDQAVMTAEASEDEQPADFMRDAKAVAGLGSFNNRGQMRVGGS